MPSLPKLPSSDLLDRVRGVEDGLRTGRRLSAVGWTGFLLTAVPTIVAAARDADGAGNSVWVAILAGAAALFLLLANATRIWVRESRRPFRYTYSISTFEPVAPTPPTERLCWLAHDLTERVSERIHRLSRLPEPEGGSGDSHIEIGGQYVVRSNDSGVRMIEILPWVSIGPAGEAQTAGHPVNYDVGRRRTGAAGAAEAARASGDLEPLVLPREDYDKIFERVYFSVASQIYRRIREDVEHKIALLPPGHLRATAYFHEAEDYARSNTLDAYEGARDLYRRALELYDPRHREPPDSRVRRGLRALSSWRAGVMRRGRRLGAHLWPRIGRRDVLIARSAIGLADMLVYRRLLALLSGARLNPVFEARSLLEEAMTRLDVLPDDVPGQRDGLFEAHVSHALVQHLRGSLEEPAYDLDTAARLRPDRAPLYAPYLFARGLLEGRPRTAVSLMRRAVEADPYFEVAQFQLAHLTEMIWRTRPTFERGVAEMVFEEYRQVLRLNPGNLAAWASTGYLWWLLGCEDRAEEALLRGRDYKLIKSDTFVAELDYGIARLAAERGHWLKAYRHYLQAVPAYLGQGKDYFENGTGAQNYYFDFISRQIVRRFEDYVENVRRAARGGPLIGDVPQRVRESVLAFALNDHGEACHRYFLRSGDERWRADARKAFDEASRLNPGYVMPHYNLYVLEREAAVSLTLSDPRDESSLEARLARIEALDEAIRHLEEASRLEPDWIGARLDQITTVSYWLPRARSAAEALQVKAGQQRELAADEEAAAELDRELCRLPNKASGHFERRAVEHRQEVLKLRLDAERCEGDSMTLLNRIKQRESNAVHELLPGLLPGFMRVSRHDGPQQVREPDDGAPVREGSSLPATADAVRKAWRRSRRRWDREFSDLNAEAMLAWARSVVSEDPPDTARALAELYGSCLRSEDDFELNILRLRLSGSEGDSRAEKRIAGHVVRWLQRDPIAYSALRWVPDAKSLTADRGRDLLLDAARPGSFEVDPALSAWLGERLETLTLAESRGDGPGGNSGSPGGLVERWVDVRRVYERAITDAMAMGSRSRAGEVAGREDATETTTANAARLGRVRVLLALGDSQGERGEVIRGLDEVADRPDGDPHGLWRTRLVAELRDRGHLAAPGRHEALGAWLDTQHGRATAAGDRMGCRDIAQARLALLDDRRQCVPDRAAGREPDGDATPEERVLWVEPIVIAAGSRLLPPEKLPIADHALLPGYPEMRERLRCDLGITLPGIRLGSDPEMPPDAYLLRLNGSEVTGGTACPDERFVPDDAPAAGLGRSSSGLDSDLPGRWVAEAALSEPERENAWTPLEFVVRRLERIVHAQPDLFAGVEEVCGALRQWTVEDDECAMSRQQRFEKALPSAEAKLRLAHLARDLLREGVSLADQGQLLNAFVATSDPPLGRIARVERARLLMRERLPANRDDRLPVPLPRAVEAEVAAAIRGTGEDRILIVSEAQADRLLAHVRAAIDPVPAHRAAIVVSAAEVRPFVRRLVHAEIPTLAVLARRELFRPLDPLGRRRWERSASEAPA